jgi:hypothetical protein
MAHAINMDSTFLINFSSLSFPSVSLLAQNTSTPKEYVFRYALGYAFGLVLNYPHSIPLPGHACPEGFEESPE